LEHYKSPKSVGLDDVGVFLTTSSTYSPSPLVVGSCLSSKQKRRGVSLVSRSPLSQAITISAFATSGVERVAHPPSCLDRKMQQSCLAQMDIVAYSGIGDSFPVASGTAPSHDFPAIEFRSPELNKAEQVRKIDQLEHVRKLKAERDRLEVELHTAQTAYVQTCAKLMEEEVKMEDLSNLCSRTNSAHEKSYSTFSPSWNLNIIGSYLLDRQNTVAGVARSIPSKRPCPTAGKSDPARAQKRMRYN
jgi:hypothetical protein